MIFNYDHYNIIIIKLIQQDSIQLESQIATIMENVVNDSVASNSGEANIE